MTSDQRGGNSKTVQTVSYTIGDDNKGTKCLVFQDQDLTMLKLDDWILKTGDLSNPQTNPEPGAGFLSSFIEKVGTHYLAFISFFIYYNFRWPPSVLEL